MDIRKLLTDARAQQQRGELVVAKQTLEKILQFEPNNFLALHYLGLLYAQQEAYSQAVEYFQQALRQNSHSAELYNHLGNAYKCLKQYDQAITQYRQAIAIEPEYPPALNNLGTAHYQQGKYELAREYYHRALELAPDYRDAHYNMALVCMQLSQFPEAVPHLETVVKLQPDNFQAHFYLANILYQQDKVELAKQHYQSAIDLNSNYVDAYQNLAALAMKQQDFTSANKHYQHLIAQGIETATVYFNMAIIAANQNQTTRAIQLYHRAVELQPDYVEAWHNLGVAYFKQDNIEQAQQCYKKALIIQPDNPILSHMLQALEADNQQQATPIAYVKNLFDGYAGHYDKHLRQDLKYQVPELLFQAFAKVIKVSNFHGRILDLGCGTGLAGELFHDLAYYLLGIDISNKMITVADKKNIYTELIVGDLNFLMTTLPTNFDLVLAADVLGYIGELEYLFTQVRRILNKDGKFIFSIELLSGDGYSLQKTARFAHSESYIKHLATKNQFDISYADEVTLRTQQQQPVSGMVFVLESTLCL